MFGFLIGTLNSEAFPNFKLTLTLSKNLEREEVTALHLDCFVSEADSQWRTKKIKTSDNEASTTFAQLRGVHHTLLTQNLG